MKPHAALAVLALLGALAAGPSHASGKPGLTAPSPSAVVLPGDARAASVRADPRTWIVGVRPRSVAAARIARAHGARRIAGAAWAAPRQRARALAAALRSRGVLDYAEPNRLGRIAQAPPDDPLSPRARWREFVVGAVEPPPGGPTSPLIAMVDSQLDITHPEFSGSNVSTIGSRPVLDELGTGNAAVAAAPVNGVGIVGIWPGASVLNVSVPDPHAITCGDSARGIARAVRQGAAVINLDYGSRTECIAETVQILRAVRAGAVTVAAGGMEEEAGDPPAFPADSPHVLTVGAILRDDRPASFSSESLALDLTAPGAGILTAVPVFTDLTDGDADGYSFLHGTGVAASMVSAAVAWVSAARPELTPGQVAQVVRLGARDVGVAGRDSATGFGVLSVGGALSEPAPPRDPDEPNDDISLVDGHFFDKAATPLSSGRRATVAGTIDRIEDPADVYRIRLPAGGRARVGLSPGYGDPDLYLMSGKARSVRHSRRMLGRSRRGSGRTDAVTVRNRARKRATVYAVVRFSSAKLPGAAEASYLLAVGPR